MTTEEGLQYKRKSVDMIRYSKGNIIHKGPEVKRDQGEPSSDAALLTSPLARHMHEIRTSAAHIT